MSPRSPANGPRRAETHLRLSHSLKPLLALSGLLIASCATPQTRFVPTYCLNQQQFDQLKAQEPPKVKDQLTGQADRDTQILGGSAIRLRAWGEGELQVLGGCVQPANTEAAH